MPKIEVDIDRYELERLEERELADREEERAKAEREHEYRVAKLKYSTGARHRMWGRVLIAFAKAPALFVLAFTLKDDAPEHWKKFIEL